MGQVSHACSGKPADQTHEQGTYEEKDGPKVCAPMRIGCASHGNARPPTEGAVHPRIH
jgi:hypothetical protein